MDPQSTDDKESKKIDYTETESFREGCSTGTKDKNKTPKRGDTRTKSIDKFNIELSKNNQDHKRAFTDAFGRDAWQKLFSDGATKSTFKLMVEYYNSLVKDNVGDITGYDTKRQQNIKKLAKTLGQNDFLQRLAVHQKVATQMLEPLQKTTSDQKSTITFAFGLPSSASDRYLQEEFDQKTTVIISPYGNSRMVELFKAELGDMGKTITEKNWHSYYIEYCYLMSVVMDLAVEAKVNCVFCWDGAPVSGEQEETNANLRWAVRAYPNTAVKVIVFTYPPDETAMIRKKYKTETGIDLGEIYCNHVAGFYGGKFNLDAYTHSIHNSKGDDTLSKVSVRKIAFSLKMEKRPSVLTPKYSAQKFVKKDDGRVATPDVAAVSANQCTIPSPVSSSRRPSLS